MGDNYIILSNQDGKYDGDGEPAVGDNIVQLGFQGANPIRTSAIILSATASDAPSTKYYQGITTFSLQDCEVKDEGFEGGQFHSRIYGTYYVGDREQSNYISYDPLTKTATFKGVAIFEPGTTLPDGTPIEQLQDIGIKSGNMLLNSGFTGDYTSQQFDEKTEISDETAIFSDSAKYWESENAEFIETEESASGHAVNLTEGGLAQQISEKLISGEKYTLSFKASGKSLKFTVGGYSENMQLTDELKRYSVIFSCSDPEDKRFRIFEATACVMEITLNQGNLPVQWQTAFDDQDKTLASLEAFQYLTAAITEAKTTVNGGLVMTQDIRVGQYRNGKMVRETGGMSGYAATRNSPFIWGGGDMLQAFYTIGKYIYDPGYMATDEELKKMCSFVLTHGGRAILNDIILHGYIYAKGGVLQSVRSPNGNFSIDEQGNVVLKGNVTATSGSFGGFKITDKQMHSEGDGYTFDIYKDRLVYADLKNKTTWIVNSTDEDGLKMSLSNEDSSIAMNVTDYGASMTARGGKFHSTFSKNYLGITADFGYTFEFQILSGTGVVRMPLPKAGIKCWVKTDSNYMQLKMAGLPTDGSKCEPGQVYVENGVLKLKS